MKTTILKDKQFRVSHACIDNGDLDHSSAFTIYMNEPIIFSTCRPWLMDGRLIAYSVLSVPGVAFEIDLICDALEYGFATRGDITLELIN